MGKLKDLFCFTLFKKNIYRYLPLMLIDTVVLFFMSTYKLVRLRSEWAISEYELGLRFKEELFAGSMGTDVWILFLMACAAGMCIFSYKFRKKSANSIHALPVQRKTLYFTVVLSGIVIMFLPLLLNAAAMTALLAAYGMLSYIKYVGIYLILLIIITMTGFSIACLCCHLSSSMVTVPILFVFLNSLAVLIEAMILNLMSVFLYGAGNIKAGVMNEGNLITEYLSPVYKLIRGGVSAQYIWVRHNWELEVEVHWHVFLIYLAASILLFIAGYLLYKKYRAEQTGDILLFKSFRYALQYIVGFMLAYYAAAAEYTLWSRQTIQNRLLSYCLFMVLAGTIAFFVFEMIVEKKWNVFAGAWKRFIPYLLAIAVIPCLFEADVFGYEMVFPEMDEIECVYFEDYYGYGYTRVCHNKELIEKTRKLHEAILEHKDLLEETGWDQSAYYGGYGSSAWLYENVVISYELKNGKKIKRYYTVNDRDNRVGMKEYYYDLVTDPEYIITDLFGEDYEERMVRKVRVESNDRTKNYFDQKALKVLNALIKDIRENDALKDYTRYHNFEIVERLELQLSVKIDEEETYIYGLSPDSENLIETLRELGYDVDKLLGLDEEDDDDYYPYYDH